MWRPPPGNDKVTHLVRKWKQKSAPPLPASLSIWFLSTQECLPGNSWKQKDPGFPPALGSQAPLQDHSIACRQMPGVVKGCPPVGLGMYRLTWEAGESFQLPRGIRGARNASPRGLKCLPPASLVNLYCEQNAVGGKKQTRCVCVCVCVCVCGKRLRNVMLFLWRVSKSSQQIDPHQYVLEFRINWQGGEIGGRASSAKAAVV